MSYSNGSGGTLTLPSPTHAHSHHVDVGSAVRSLRRSLSRSPSKFRLTGRVSPSPESSVNFHQHLSRTPITRFDNIPTPAASTTPIGPPPSTSFFSTPQATVATPFKANTNFKLSVRSARTKLSAGRPLSRSSRISPKSPLKRVFGPAPDSGNPLPSSFSGPEARGQENRSFGDFALALSPRGNLDKPSRHSMHLDVSGSSKLGLTKFLDSNNDPFPTTSVSPLKRSDAIMSLDQTNLGSPVAKRRSLHGVSGLASEFNIFDYTPPPPSSHPQEQLQQEQQQEQPQQQPQVFDVHGDASQEYQLTSSFASPFRDLISSTTPLSMPKRTSSLRKSTLQQRHGESRTSWGRRAGEKQLAQLANEATTPNTRTRPRLSLDQYLPPDERGSPFSPQAALPNPSAHPLPRPTNQPHPLSRTLTQSSSSSSLPDDSPTHIPVHIGEKPRLPMNFSKSLPPGALRPTNDADPVATPQYKRAKPFQAAFMSTGLVSKMTRNPDLGPVQQQVTKITAMPDTPCKKQPYNSATYPPQLNSGRRQSRASFGSPSTPFSPASGRVRGNSVFGNTDRPGSIFFQQVRAGHGRKTSLLSLDGDDHAASAESHDDFPPTPTKNLFFKSFSTPTQIQTPSTSRTYPLPNSTFGFDDEQPMGNCSSSPLNHLDFADDCSPRTPREDSLAPPDPSYLSISNSQDESGKPARPPATPTTQGRHLFSSFGDRRISTTPQHGHGPKDVDESLVVRFDKSEVIGKGEFSQVYRVVNSAVPASLAAAFAATPSKRTPPGPSSDKVFAVKKVRLPMHGAKGREAKLREVSILKELSNSDKIVHYLDSWEQNGYLYIQTEFCTEGSLDGFLKSVGQAGRLDDFRIWKILLETCQGLAAVHDAGFIHLDVKPANIFIGFDGYLKIGDFGMAAEWPAPKGIEGEGDREYIGPEILLGQYDKPADIFALGLIILEIACNVFLPDNGPTWQALRNGDLSTVPSLTSSEASAVLRDANGMPIEHESGISQLHDDDDSMGLDGLGKRRAFPFEPMTHDPSNLFGAQRRSELLDPPTFMTDANDPISLDSVVRWMIQPEPADRPTARQLLESESISWVCSRRAAGATVYEGNWGPQVSPSVEEPVDTEMTDV
ncbi:hypothetical protein B0T22DRAFT_196154 [Podospora appendiculata]|uniref:Protein kinase domain-containing protein n=1 Tax=Podospora appendiculata TaxID=314037 RepID=A0AAE1C9P2_9PEZI|nr:hypothetical protein B0T22DRAFT_196154 [Podospora appendiculata]